MAIQEGSDALWGRRITSPCHLSTELGFSRVLRFASDWCIVRQKDFVS